MHRLIRHRHFWSLPILLWTGLVAASLVWNWQALDRHAAELAANRGRFVFKVVESIRLWNAKHGGLYAPINDWTPPNRYLDVPERDITTPSGIPLTLVNPAYMTRQLAETIAQQSDIRIHLTSLKPLNPGNAPANWERDALLSFEKGGQEYFVLTAGSEPFSRYMAPLRTEEQCLKCHEKQGYKLGDIRGGVSVSFPTAELVAAVALQKRNLVVVHGAAWLLLSLLTLAGLRRIRADMASLHAANERQEQVVEQRTAELRTEIREREEAEARLRLLLESSGEGIYGVDREGRLTFINALALRLLGYSKAEEVLGRPIHPLIHHTDVDGHARPVEECDLLVPLMKGAAVHRDDDIFWRADGSSFPVEYRGEPLVIDGVVTGAVVTFNDVTVRKRQERELKKLFKAVEHSPESVLITDAEGHIEYVNRKFQEVTGYSAEEVIGQKPSVLKSGRTDPELYAQLWSNITKGRVWKGSVLNRKRNGELFWEEEAISPITDERGVITHFVGVKEDITKRRELEEKIWRQANYDFLTGLPNRILFHDRLGQALAHADRAGGTVAVMFIDLDRFKEVNDTLGHQAGDLLLQEAAKRLEGCVRRSDTVARMGGDEFTVILPSCTSDSGDLTTAASVVAGKILGVLRRPFELGEHSFTISASIGIACYPRDGNTVQELMRNADTAMYRAKETGRDDYRYFNEAQPHC